MTSQLRVVYKAFLELNHPYKDYIFRV